MPELIAIACEQDQHPTAKPTVDPETIIGEAPAAERAEAAPENEAATERE